MARTIAINLLGYDNLSRSFNSAARSATMLQNRIERLNTATNAVGLATLAGGLMAVTRAAAPAVAAVAALPAALVAVKLATMTVKVGMTGMGDAMKAVAEGDAKKLDKAMKNLAPSAQAFVKQFAQVKKEFDGVQKAVQQNLFAGLDKELKGMATATLPTMKTGMSGLATAMNGMAKEASAAIRTSSTQGHLNSLFSQTTGIVNTLKGAIGPLINIVLKLSDSGMSLVQRMADWIAKGARAASEFLNTEKGANTLRATIKKAGDVTAQLGRILGNVAAGLIAVTNQAKDFKSSGDDILTTLEKGTVAFKNWAQSMKGQEASSDVFKLLGDTLKSIMTILPLVLGPIGAVVKVIMSLPGPVRDVVIQMVAWGVVINLVIGRLKLLAIASAAFAGGQAAVGFVGGMMNMNRATAEGASRATRYGAALRMNAAIAKMWIAEMVRSAAASAAATARTVAQTVATKAAAVATRAWALATIAFNAVLAGNPIALIIIAIIALVAAIVIAYKRSEKFRAIVQAAWAGIKQAAAIAWNFLKQVFDGIVNVVTTYVIPGFKLLWTGVKLVWEGIKTVISAVWPVIKGIFNAIASVVKGVLMVAFIVLKNAVKVVWIAIQIAIKVAWAAIKVYFAAIKWYISNVLAPIFKWLWNNIIKPVWNGIKAAIKSAWENVIRPVWQKIRAFLTNTLAPEFKKFRATINVIWNAVKDTIVKVWNNHIKPAFNRLKEALGTVKNAFSKAVDGIRSIWNRIQDIAKKPVNFVIGIYNAGIVGLVNKIADFAGIKTRLTPIPRLATGGVLPGYAPGKDKLLAAVSPGESVFRPEFTRAVGSKWVANANAVARRQGTAGVSKWMTGQGRMGGEGLHFARGGVVPGFAGNFDIGGIIGGVKDKLKNFTFGSIEKLVSGALNKLIGLVPGSGAFRDAIAGIPVWIKKSILEWVKNKVGFGGGPGVERALAFARAQAGKPYLWGGVGPGGYDCSGFMSAIWNVIKGKSPYSRVFTTHGFNSAGGPGGFVPGLRSGFMVGVTHAGVGHMGGTLGGVDVESSGSAGVRVGPAARGVGDALFPFKYGLKADTGALALRPGWNPPTFNGTGKPEFLTTRATGGDIHIHNHGVIGSQTELDQWLVTSMERLRRRNKLVGS